MNNLHHHSTTVSCLKRNQQKSPFDHHMMIDLVNPTTIVKFKKPKNVNFNVNVVNATSVKPLNTITFKNPVFTPGASTSATTVPAKRTKTNVKKAKKSNNGRHRQEEKKGNFKLGFVNSKGEHVCRLCGTNCVTMKLFSRHQSRRYSYEELETIFASSKVCKGRRHDNEVIDVDELEERDEDVLLAARTLMFMTGDHRSEVCVEGLKESVGVGRKKVVHEFDLNVAIDLEEDMN